MPALVKHIQPPTLRGDDRVVKRLEITPVALPRTIGKAIIGLEVWGFQQHLSMHASIGWSMTLNLSELGG